MINVEMNDNEFKIFRDFIYEKSGINYTDNKKIILQNRIRRRMRELSINSYSEYFELIKNKQMENEEVIKFFDEVTTNETSFFRHDRQFIALEKMIIPELLQIKKTKEISVWSAAASTGKEAYTISMILNSIHELHNYKIGIIGTDLNQKVLEIARNGEYDLKDEKDIPSDYKRFYDSDIEKGIMKFKSEVKKNIEFKRYNLKDSFSSIPKMDIIFCRNVFIYFEKKTQSEIVTKFYDKLVPGGFFILGHSETFNDLSKAI